MQVNGTHHAERRSAGEAIVEEARVLKLEAERTGQDARKNIGTYRGFMMWLRIKPNHERSLRSLIEESSLSGEILLNYGAPQVLVAHVSESDTGTVMSIDATIRSIDGEITKNDERVAYLASQVEKYHAVLGEEWEHASKLENLAARLALVDKELISAGVKLSDSSVAVVDEEETVEEIETIPTLDDEKTVDFNLEEILGRINELVASTKLPEDTAITLPSLKSETVAIPVTPAALADLRTQAQTAQALAEFEENLLIGTQKQMTLNDLWKVDGSAQTQQKKAPSRRKEIAADLETVQLTLF